MLTSSWVARLVGMASSTFLKEALVPILPTELCNKAGWYGGIIDDSMICAGYAEGGTDACSVSDLPKFIHQYPSSLFSAGGFRWSDGVQLGRSMGATWTHQLGFWMRPTQTAWSVCSGQPVHRLDS